MRATVFVILTHYFSQFSWYMPAPNLRMEDIILTEKEKSFIDKHY